MNMPTSTESAVVWCASCRKTQAQLSTPLKQCARCTSTKYCSTECQRADWPRHKQVCTRSQPATEQREPEATGPRLRAITRMNLGRRSEAVEDETIFFVEKSTPHLDDVSVAGPFYPRSAIVGHIKYHMHGISYAGLEMMKDVAKDPRTLKRMEHIKGPLDTDPSKFIILRVISMHDPEMASRLPGPVYNVVRTVLFPPEEYAQREASSGPSPYPRFKAMDIEGCYATADKAIVKAKEVVANEAQSFRRLEAIKEFDLIEGEAFSVGIFGDDATGRPAAVSINVMHDDGKYNEFRTTE